MRVAGIIAEFNPFHDGHAVHLKETREMTGCERIVAVMSGNFVQRGEPALCDKWRRTRMALLAGVDIVIELPVPYVVSGADYFARGSVQLLAATKVVDVLSFGSECGKLEVIKTAGRILAKEPILYKFSLRRALDAGKSFAAARNDALAMCLINNLPDLLDGFLTKPNNGLAMEYCKALELLGNSCSMKAFTTHRQKDGPSATKIREAFRRGEPVETLPGLPDFVREILHDVKKTGETAKLDDFSDVFRYLLFRENSVGILGKGNLGEGLLNRFRRLCGDHSRLSDLLSAVKTKRYTYTRLQRAALGVVLGISAADMAESEKYGGMQYIRVLGFRRDSVALLSEMTEKAAFPVITHGAKIDEILRGDNAASKILAKDLECGDIYRLATGAKGGSRSERAAGIIVI